MKPMRIAIQSVFPPFRGGISTFGRFTLKTLKQEIGDDQVTGFNFTRLYPSLLFPGKTQYLENREPEPGTQGSVHAYNPIQWSNAVQDLLAFKPDVYLYAHWHPFFCPVQNKIMHSLKKSRPDMLTVGILHNVEPHESFPFSRRLIKRMLRKTDIPVVLSSQTESEYNSMHLGKKVCKLFHPIYEQSFPEESRTEIRKRFGVLSDETVLLFFGLVREYKGLDVLIEALNGINMAEKRIRLFIVGEFYIDRDAIMEAAKHDNLTQITVVDEFVSDEDAARYLSMSDVMVLPYKTASQSGILSNALNFNMPVICSDHPGLAEQVKHGVTGLLVEPGNAVSLEEAICKMLDVNLRSEMSESVGKYKEKLSWKRFGGALYETINNYRNTAF